MQKSAEAFRTISEVADDLSLPQHVLRFWETRFPQIRPLKRAGGRRYYRPADVGLLRTIRQLLYDDGYTIKGVQRLLKEQGSKGLATGGSRQLDLDAGVVHDLDDEERDNEGRGTDERDLDERAPTDAGEVGSTSTMASEAHATRAPSTKPPNGDYRAAIEEALESLEECKKLLLDALARPSR